MADRWMGGCNCGAVRFEATGAPRRSGICHCTTCRKETGGPFMWFAVWPRDRVTVSGATQRWRHTTDDRHFCPVCGSAQFATDDANEEIEIRLGSLDTAPSGIEPQYELWFPRREPWLPAVHGAAQHDRNRPV